MALLLNLALTNLGPRGLAAMQQGDARDYGNVAADVRQLQVDGKSFFGDPAYWYAVNQQGGILQFGFLGFVVATRCFHNQTISKMALDRALTLITAKVRLPREISLVRAYITPPS